MSESQNKIDIVSSIEKHWHKKTGLIAFALVLTGVEAPILTSINASYYVYVGSLFLTYLFLFLVWVFSNRLPKTQKGRIGFAVSIFCDPEESTNRVRSDFIVTLRKLVKSGRVGKTFQFIEIPQHVAKNVIDEDNARLLRIKCKAHFFLYGRVRLRDFQKEQRHFIELDGVVAHHFIPEDVSKILSKEFGELLPRKVIIARENDLLSFEFTSQWAELVAKYIIGIAAALSKDLDYAEKLYGEVFDRLQTITYSFPVFEKLKERVPVRLFELNAARADAAYHAWVRSHDERYLKVMENHLGKIDLEKHSEIMVLTLNSIHVFLTERDVEKARKLLNRCKKEHRVAIWYMNQAFLAAYAEDLKRSLQHYRKALKFDISADLLSKIEDFIVYIVKIEPEKYQLYYCLGFFNWKFKGDNIQAIKDLEKFLSHENKDEFVKAKEIAGSWLKEIRDTQKEKTQ